MTSWRIRLEPQITPFFRAWWRISRGMTLGVRAIACDEAGRVLLVRHTYAAGWHLPGGGVERGETALEAAVRELREEGGVEPIESPKLIGLFSNHANFPNDHIALFYVAAWRPCPPTSAGEIAERAFFGRDPLPPDTSKGTRRRLAEVFDGAAVSALW
jgi:ADP-ribose pyrophosphatase YjhB (NUDIX family)